MTLFNDLINYIMHLDTNLLSIINYFGHWAYVIVFTIIFLETALVLTPFLPGDSLIFASGALAGIGVWNVWILFLLLTFAAIIGDTVNYSIGKFIGPRVFKYESKLLNKEYLDKTRNFFEKYGSKTIIIARFIPIIRTFAPFLAGVGQMNYFKFLLYNIIGGLFWVGFFLWGGYFFGNIPFVKEHFTFIILAIIIISLIPAGLEFYRHWKENKRKNK
ncbi:MAG: membrane protein [Candidatus Woesearchaeota archaeon]|nr:MAG: membrane protein [Candidatus Woesearchaeota archaeon]